MSFFYNLNKTLASIAGKDKVTAQATESVQQSELKTILESSYSAVHNKTEEGNEFSGALATPSLSTKIHLMLTARHTLSKKKA